MQLKLLALAAASALLSPLRAGAVDHGHNSSSLRLEEEEEPPEKSLRLSARPRHRAAVMLTSQENSARGQHTAAEPKVEDCNTLLGLSKFTWAMLCNFLALAIILLCIPLLLTCSKRRPLGSAIFEWGKIWGGNEYEFKVNSP
eukprot:TRINITY_DN71285_c0_g1_i1.p1 TRINITY_DN71285_c0_g1~~TRINITY_DN71285_c0_g1_i1.p1  ORF type:complete len:143 (+),score=33.77 TRINITY_DN71285_c0_g1_i1:75-503(+)